MKKWKQSPDSSVSSFVSYFKSQWLDENTGWHEGTALGFPYINNRLEATNRWVKEHETYCYYYCHKRVITVIIGYERVTAHGT